MLTRNFLPVVGWAKANFLYHFEFEECTVKLWAFVPTWDKDTFRWVAVAVLDRFSSDATHDLSVLGSVLAAVGGSVSRFAFSGGSHVLADTCSEYLGNR